MFAQFFGNYLLNQRLVTAPQLAEAMTLTNGVRLKVGVLAINAGYMTAEQVDTVHDTQTCIDKRFGEIAIDRGYLTYKQVNELLSKQRSGHLLIAQVLLDKEYLTSSQLEAALNTYKLRYTLSDDDFNSDQSDKVEEVIKSFYNFGKTKFSDLYSDYVSLLFKNIIRFIGDDFTPLSAQYIVKKNCNMFASQNICGEFDAYTAIEGEEDAFLGFASRYAEEKFTVSDELSTGSVSEFLNLVNGIFTVNMSTERQLELEIAPQITGNKENFVFEGDAYCIPVAFSFGTINFLLCSENPIYD